MSGSGRFNVDRILGLAVLAAVLVYTRQKLFYPLEVLVVFFHELGHAAGALLTGGSVGAIHMHFGGLAGTCWTGGGSRIVTASAGYVGSTLFGSLMLLAACRTRLHRTISCLIGALLVGVTLRYVDGATGMVIGLGYGALFLAAGAFLPDDANDLLLSFLGLATMSFALRDVYQVALGRPGLTDAHLLSRELGLPPLFWALSWALASALIAVKVLSWSIQRRRA